MKWKACHIQKGDVWHVFYFTRRDRGTNKLHVSNASSSTHNLSKWFPCYFFPQGAPMSNCLLVYLQNEMCCLLCSPHLWKIQMNKSWYKRMWLLLLMESTMESKPKAERCRSAWGTWTFRKLAAWLPSAGTAGTRKISQSLSRQEGCVVSRITTPVDGFFTHSLTVSPYLPPSFSSPPSLAHFAYIFITAVIILWKAIWLSAVP